MSTCTQGASRLQRTAMESRRDSSLSSPENSALTAHADSSAKGLLVVALRCEIANLESRLADLVARVSRAPAAAALASGEAVEIKTQLLNQRAALGALEQSAQKSLRAAAPFPVQTAASIALGGCTAWSVAMGL